MLYPAPLRDFLMWLALSGCFRARWSAQIHDEWQRNLLRNRPDLLSNPSIGIERYLDILRRQGLSRTAAALTVHRCLL